MRLRPPDWLIYLGVAAALLAAVVVGQLYQGHPRSTGRNLTAESKGGGHAPPSPSAFDATVTVAAPPISTPGTGTAFSISSGGVWLTARHVVEGCARTAIVVAPGQGVAAEVRIDPRGETAVLITQGGAPALPIAPRESLKPGMTAFHAGFPRGSPGQIATQLLGRQTLVLRGRHGRRETVLAWVQTNSSDALPPSLAGLSGAPALDSQGRVVGVTIAQSRRRRRVYTTTPGALRAALARVHVELATGAQAAPMSEGSFSRISNDLRGDLRIVPVVCLAN
jgi:S1-C subfamily serine protease